ncbi:hypothetical protein N9267_01175 [bacterium]|nr:hypothetical protein [bacterium]
MIGVDSEPPSPHQWVMQSPLFTTRTAIFTRRKDASLASGSRYFIPEQSPM